MRAKGRGPSPTRLRARAAAIGAAVFVSAMLAGAEESKAERAPAATAAQARLDRAFAELERQRAELDALRVALDTHTATEAVLPDAVADVDRFRVYGFTSAGLQRTWATNGSAAGARIDSATATFVLADVNLYFDARPIDHWQAFTEVRLTPRLNTELSPNGAAYGAGSVARNSSAQVGGLFIERAYVQYTPRDWFAIRAGYWLTPYGIWNVDHGAPTLIPVMLPQFIASEWFPTRQLGIDFLGTFLVSDWTLGYHLYVSNGRGTRTDRTDDKMLGGRFSASTRFPLPVTIGMSWFRGRYSNGEQRPNPASPFAPTDVETIAYNEFGVAADVSLDVGRWRFRAEWLMRQVMYDDGKRDVAWGNPTWFVADHRSTAAYVLAAWRLPFLGLEPYGYFEVHRDDSPFGQYTFIPSLGVNVHFNASAQLKVQYAYARDADVIPDAGPTHLNSIHILTSRLVLAF